MIARTLKILSNFKASTSQPWRQTE